MSAYRATITTNPSQTAFGNSLDTIDDWLAGVGAVRGGPYSTPLGAGVFDIYDAEDHARERGAIGLVFKLPGETNGAVK